MKNNNHLITSTCRITLMSGRQGELPTVTWHGGRQGDLPQGGAWHGGFRAARHERFPETPEATVLSFSGCGYFRPIWLSKS